MNNPQLIISMVFLILGFITPSMAESISTNESSTLLPVVQTHQWGFINPRGKIVIPLQYDEASNFSEGLSPIKTKNLWGYIDTNGKMMIQPHFEYATVFHGGFAGVCLNGKWGAIDKKGQSVIEPRFFHDPSAFSEGFFLVNTNDAKLYKKNYVFFEASSKPAFSQTFRYASPFNKGMAFVAVEKSWMGKLNHIQSENLTYHFIDQNGNIVLTTDTPQGELETFTGGKWDGGKFFTVWGQSCCPNENIFRILDKSGKILLDETGEVEYSEGFFCITTSFPIQPGTGHINVYNHYFLNDGFNNPFNSEFMAASSFSEGLAYVEKYKNPKDVGKIRDFSIVRHKDGTFDAIAPVIPKGDSGFMDRTGKLVLNAKFDDVKGFKEGFCAVQKGKLWGFIRKDGSFLVSPRFSDVESFQQGIAKVYLGDYNTFGYINAEGKGIWPPNK